MKQDLAELEAILRNRICIVCSSRDAAGNCGLDNPASCALFQFLPQLAKTIAETHSDSIGDYIQAIRRNVCSICAEQSADGSCELRQQAQCALDAYLVPIVGVIEEVTGQSFNRTNLTVPITGAMPGVFTENFL